MAVTTRRGVKKKTAAAGSSFLELLPRDVILEVAKHVHESEALAFVLTCKAFRDAREEALKEQEKKSKRKRANQKMRTVYYYHFNSRVRVSDDWIKWAFSMKWEWENLRDETEEHKKNLLLRVAGYAGSETSLCWLKKQGCDLGREACWGAARGGQLKLLKWLKSEIPSFAEYIDPSMCHNAAFGGHVKVLEYLKSEGMAFNSAACSKAAVTGHLDVLKYLKSEGAPFDSKTCWNAAYWGHLEILKWLRSEGCPWDAQECLRVAKRKEMREWISNGTHLEVGEWVLL
jgi:hypothetical protein